MVFNDVTDIFVYLIGSDKLGALHFSSRRWHFGKFLITSVWFVVDTSGLEGKVLSLFCNTCQLDVLSSLSVVTLSLVFTFAPSTGLAAQLMIQVPLCHQELCVCVSLYLLYCHTCLCCCLCFRTCLPPWSALRACSRGLMRGVMAPSLLSILRQASSTPMLCCPGLCCSPSVQPASLRMSCASKNFSLNTWNVHSIYHDVQIHI